jgi:hypothetical protein
MNADVPFNRDERRRQLLATGRHPEDVEFTLAIESGELPMATSRSSRSRRVERWQKGPVRRSLARVP